MAEAISDLGDYASQEPTAEHKGKALFIKSLTQEGRRRYKSVTQIPLDYYFIKQKIDKEQRQAGETIYDDFRLSGISLGMKSCLNVSMSNGQSMGYTNSEAYQRYRSGINSITGKVHQLIVFNVCCVGAMLSDINHVGVDLRNRMKYFRAGLDDLTRYYDESYKQKLK